MNNFTKRKTNIFVITGLLITLLAVGIVLLFTDGLSSKQVDANSFLDSVSLDIPEDPVKNQLIIKFAEGTTEEERLAYIESVDGTVAEEIQELNTLVVSFPTDISEDSLPESEIVAESEPDYYVGAMQESSNPTEATEIASSDQEYSAPNDPYYDQQWALEVMNVPQVWEEIPENAEKVIVAVVDSGVCLDHPDLEGRILPGYDFVEDDNEPQDEFDHGCGVAGVIAANTDNGIGIAGIAPNAMILPVRVLDENGLGTYSDLAAGIVWAADNGAEIINLSLGGYNESEILKGAIDYASFNNVIIVAAAGNTSNGVILYPAAYNEPNSVGSVEYTENSNHYPSSFSSKSREVDLWSFGENIMSLSNDGKVMAISGTSIASSIVSSWFVMEISGDQDTFRHFTQYKPAESDLLNNELGLGEDQNTDITAQAIVEVYQPCNLVNGAFDLTGGEYNINIGRDHYGQNESVDIGAAYAQPSYGNSYQRCKDYIARASVEGTVHKEYSGSFYCSATGTNVVNTELYINTPDGKHIEYLHMDFGAANTVAEGTYVYPGDTLGTIGDVGCSTPGFEHIHFSVYNSSWVRLDYSQWKFKPLGACTPPSSGTWNITSNCTINGTVSAPNVDIHVSNGATLTVNGILDFDSIGHKLLVDANSKVLVDPSGKIY